MLLFTDVAENIADNWTVQRQKNNSFASIPCDQTIEQTMNKDSKTKGGIVGFTVNKGAVHRWILGQNERCAISRNCQQMANITEVERYNLIVLVVAVDICALKIKDSNLLSAGNRKTWTKPRSRRMQTLFPTSWSC